MVIVVIYLMAIVADTIHITITEGQVLPAGRVVVCRCVRREHSWQAALRERLSAVEGHCDQRSPVDVDGDLKSAFLIRLREEVVVSENTTFSHLG